MEPLLSETPSSDAHNSMEPQLLSETPSSDAHTPCSSDSEIAAPHLPENEEYSLGIQAFRFLAGGLTYEEWRKSNINNICGKYYHIDRIPVIINNYTLQQCNAKLDIFSSLIERDKKLESMCSEAPKAPHRETREVPNPFHFHRYKPFDLY